MIAKIARHMTAIIILFWMTLKQKKDWKVYYNKITMFFSEKLPGLALDSSVQF